MTIVDARRWMAAGAALAALLYVGVRYDHHVHRHLVHTGDRLLPLTLRALDGGTASVAPAGKPQIINVFATWCPPCREETPAFAAMAARMRQRGIQVVGIDQQEGAAAVSRFAREFNLSYPVYIDPDGVTHDVLGARVIPMTIFVDANGVIRWEHSGPLSERDLLTLAQNARAAG